ncbi:MAG TPA: phosphatase domain-containing protein [Nocardioides sp.]|nr:phosphatase domain-containing protein [Nocardioides sp.]
MSQPSSERPHLAGVVEDRWNTVLGKALVRRGWRHLVLPHLGYGGPGFVRVFARVVYAPAGTRAPESDAALQRRGWRNFFTAEAIDVPVTVTVAGERHQAVTDRSGNLDARLPHAGLPPGWHDVTIETATSAPATARVLMVDDEVDFGLVSDIDDTVLQTLLPRPLLAAYHTFVLREQARQAVPGMAELYAELLSAHPGAPTIYVSTGAWNTAGTLRRFLARHAFPDGPLLLTDWGPTNTGWFRSGREHKSGSLRDLIEEFPRIRWVLVGDDGQHDPTIYGEFARQHPDRIRAIAIRELSHGQQLLAHGTPTPKDPAAEAAQPQVPEVRGPDGSALAELLRPLL